MLYKTLRYIYGNEKYTPMSTPNINYSNLDSRYNKPTDVSAAIAAQAATDDVTYQPLHSTPGPMLNLTPALLQKWRRALARVASGAGSAKLLCLGDSIANGSIFLNHVVLKGTGIIPPRAYPLY